MRTLSRKEFLKLTAGAAAASVLARPATAYAQTANFTTIAQDPTFPFRRPPFLFGATGLSSMRRQLDAQGLDQLRVVNLPHSGPYLQAWLFGGQVESAVYRQASIELVLQASGSGYHFVELFLGQIYPHAFFDATPVEIEGRLANGYPVRKFVPRLETLSLPPATIRVFASVGADPVSAFDLDLPHFRSTPTAGP